VCVCVCVCVRERERETETQVSQHILITDNICEYFKLILYKFQVFHGRYLFNPKVQIRLHIVWHITYKDTLWCNLAKLHFASSTDSLITTY